LYRKYSLFGDEPLSLFFTFSGDYPLRGALRSSAVVKGEKEKRKSRGKDGRKLAY